MRSTPWSRARRTTCRQRHAHPSGLEARTCDALALECAASGATLFRSVGFPLLSIAPKENGTPETWRADFVVWAEGKIQRVVEAKGRRSRDFELRMRAFLSTYPGVRVEVVTR